VISILDLNEMSYIQVQPQSHIALPESLDLCSR